MKIKFKVLDYIIRIYLSFSLLIYSLAKIFNTQFSNNRSSYLNMKVSELSGQDLAWVFYGYSQKYEIILGLLQLVSIILLLVNRTKIIGIIFLIPIFMNIILIDIFYDILALNSIIYYSILLLILMIINFQRICAILKYLIEPNIILDKPFVTVKHLAIIIIGVIVLTLFSLII